MKGFSSKPNALEVDVKGPEKYTICRRVRSSFCSEILQAWAVNGVNNNESVFATLHNTNCFTFAGGLQQLQLDH